MSVLATDPDTFLQQNEGLALKFASPYLRKFPSLQEDILQAARLGLVEAFHRWNPERGAFSTTASFWVRACIQDFLRNTLSPFTMGGGTVGDLLRGEGHPPVIRLDEEIGEGEDDFHEIISGGGELPYEVAERSLEKEAVVRFLETLPQEDRLLLEALHGFHGRAFSEKEMATFFGVSPREIRRRVQVLYVEAREEGMI
jgi:RNA polymerase sigma factor (sigma-70 family)